MKKYLAYLSSIIFVIALISLNYLEFKIDYYEKKNQEITDSIAFTDDVIKTNKWIQEQVIPKLDQLLSMQDAEDQMLELVDSLQRRYDAKVDPIDKSLNNIIKITGSCKIYRNNIDDVLALYKIEILNGFIDVTSVYVGENRTEYFFDIMIFHKGDKT